MVYGGGSKIFSQCLFTNIACVHGSWTFCTGPQTAEVQASPPISVWSSTDFILLTVVDVDSRWIPAWSVRCRRTPSVDAEGDGRAMAGPSFDGPRTHGHGLRAVLRRAVDPRLAAGVADGPAGKQRVPAPDGDGLGPEDHLSEDAAEALVEAQINDEVDGRVCDDERVAHAAEVELEAAAEPRRVGQEVPRQLSQQRQRRSPA